MKKEIKWGMIGCGDVTQKKSAPSFNKVDGSSLIAVTSRTKTKAEAYARDHNVPKVYDSVEELLADSDINAVYVATPPSTHAEYAIQAMKAGKPVYVEKPMAATFAECQMMNRVAESTGVPMFVAYYRRSMDYFLKVKSLLDRNVLGDLLICRLSLILPGSADNFDPENLPWRVIPEISGGGIFHDMGCHELDILEFLLGEFDQISGYAENRAKLYRPEDTVSASGIFKSGVPFSGAWSFVSSKATAFDEIEIIGIDGSIKFSCFGFTPIELITDGGKEEFTIPSPEHVQFPLIREIVQELQGVGESPSKGKSAARINRLMEEILNS